MSLQTVLAALDAVAPWQSVLASEFGRRAAGVWERDGQVYRVLGEPPESRLVGSGLTSDAGWTPSQALAEIMFDGDLLRAGRALAGLIQGELNVLSVYFRRDDVEQVRAALSGADTASSAVGSSQLPTANSASTSDCVLTDVREFIARYVVLPEPLAYDVLALWVGHTYLIDAFEVTPRLAFLSPQRGSGKTRAMDVLEMLVRGPIPAVSVTTASLFRSINQAEGRVTLLLDEVDTIFQPGNSSAEEIRGILNGGYKRGASVMRAGSKAKNFAVEHFSVFAPVAMAGLGLLPDTLMSRSIVMRMRRRRGNEPVQSFRRRDVEAEATQLRAQLKTWADRVAIKVGVPDIPAEVTDRASEIWEPLLAVADLAGQSWAGKARVAAVAAVAGSADTDDQDIKLLAGIKTVFEETGDGKIHTNKLLKKLGKQDLVFTDDLSATKLAAVLSPYGIKPSAFRVGNKNGRGYRRADFVDAWSRYLPS